MKTEKQKKIKVSLKRENEILKELGKHLFGIVVTCEDLFKLRVLYRGYSLTKIEKLERKLKKSNKENGK